MFLINIQPLTKYSFDLFCVSKTGFYLLTRQTPTEKIETV